MFNSFSILINYLKNKTGSNWHCRVPADDARGAKFYAYQIDGPSPAADFNWHTFDSEKILLDPYARAVYFPLDFNREAAIQPGSNAGRAAIGALPAPSTTADHARHVERPHHESDYFWGVGERRWLLQEDEPLPRF